MNGHRGKPTASNAICLVVGGGALASSFVLISFAGLVPAVILGLVSVLLIGLGCGAEFDA